MVNLGWLAPEDFLGGGMELQPELSRKSFEGVAEQLGMSVEEASMGALRIASASMVQSIEENSVRKGFDPRDFALVAFGGAGPLHACALADELEIGTVLVPAAAGVLSALGLVASEERHDHVLPYVRPLAEVDDLPAEGQADLRYAGQSFELTVSIQPGLAEAFHREHEERYGYADRARELELVAVRTAETTPGPEFDLPPDDPFHVHGPATVELDGATCFVAPGWVGDRDGDSTLVLTKT
jgi:N-methylhydantoinase A